MGSGGGGRWARGVGWLADRVRREAQEGAGPRARAESNAEGRVALLRVNADRSTTRMCNHQPKRSAQGTELLQPVRGETLDRGDQGARTPGLIGHTKSSPLLELEESSFRFVRHSVRWYRWASVCSETSLVGGRAAPRFAPKACSEAVDRMMRLWVSGC